MLACYPATKWVRSAAPTLAQEPVTLKEAKRQCDIAETVDAFDDQFVRLIATARETVERDAGVVCYTGTYVSKRTEWGYGDWFELPSIRPITAISSITYVATDGTTTTWSSAEYSLDTYTVCPIVKLGYGYAWPTLRGDINGITLTVTAGYATVATIPAQIKQACLLLISHWFENRGVVGQTGPEISMAYDSLIESLERKAYA